MSNAHPVERTLVLLKPDAVARKLTGQILTRYEAKGLTIVALKQLLATTDLAAAHYAEHEGRDYYPPLLEFITSGPLVALILEGERAIEIVRLMNGSTDSAKAAPGTIRGDLSVYYNKNLVHASDSPENALREIGIWFPEGA
ncbi:nucleoside-diphosphate kinase [Aestuariimicrobium soli]|uniref:nucleoside-diphosphate kinase n=1 Tax=Aestuariimicrobium soli TaxID=2035834 RepID=UPI003EB8F85F